MTSKPTRATYLVELRVQNAKSFKGCHVLDLRDEHGAPSRWTLILGENGVGKTTLLQCIAATVAHQNEGEMQSGKKGKFMEAIGVIDISIIESLFRANDTCFEIRSTFAVDAVLAGDRSPKPKTFDVGIRVERTQGTSESVEKPIEAKGHVTEPLVLSYGAGRKMGMRNLNVEVDQALQPMNSLFTDESELIDAEELIQQLDYAAMKRRTKKAERQRDTFLNMLASLLPDVQSARNFVIHGPSPVGPQEKAGVHVRVPYGDVPLRQLSFGYQTMTAWLADIAWQLFRHYPNSSNPLNEAAIVLVDEIDLHLHPRWQRELQGLLASHFPAVQFVATAHSPLMAQAAMGKNLAVVLRDDDTVRIHNDPAVIDNWRIDQVVTSELFGLTPWSPDVDRKLEEQRRLTRKVHRTAQENKQLEELDRFAQSLPTGVPKPLENAMDIIRGAASVLSRNRE